MLKGLFEKVHNTHMGNNAERQKKPYSCEMAMVMSYDVTRMHFGFKDEGEA